MTQGCPTCGHIPSNGRTHVQLDVPVAMLLSMVHALAIGRNTEKMSSNAEAGEEMEAMRLKLFDQLGKSHAHFPERGWTKLMLGAWKGKTITTEIVPAKNGWRKFTVAATLDGKTILARPEALLHDGYTEEEAKTIETLLREDLNRLSPL